MENEELLKPASVSKRAFSFIIDFVLAFIIGSVLNSFVTGVYVFDSLGGNTLQQEYYSFAKASGLVNTTEANGKITSIYLFGYNPDGKADSSDSTFVPTPTGELAYEAYLNKVWNYYTVFYPTDARMIQPEDYTYSLTELDSYKTYVYKTIFLLPDPKEVEGKTNVTLSSTDATQPYFQYATKEDGTPNLTAKPILKADVQSKVDANDSDTLTNLRNYFLTIVTSGSSTSVTGGIYYNAALHMEGQNNSGQTYFTEHYKKVQMISWECSLIALMPINFIFFYLIPIFDKKGRTLGKYIFGLATIRDDGIYMNSLQRFLRPLYMFILSSLTLIPNSSLSLIVFGVVALVDFAFLAMSKTNKGSLHDRLFKTTVVANKGSKIFANNEEKDAYLAKIETTHEENVNGSEDEVIDLSTINLHKEEAAKITSFDEFEKEKGIEQEKEEKESENKVNLTKEE